jgi:ABC-type molybdate transport system permease subunit
MFVLCAWQVLVQQNLSGGLVLEVLVIIVSIIVIALLLRCKYQRVKMAIKTLIAYTLNLYPSVHPFLTLLKTCN